MKGFPTESGNLSPGRVGASRQSDDRACCSEDPHTCRSVQGTPSTLFFQPHQAAWHPQPSWHQLARKARFRFQVNRLLLLFTDCISVVCSLISTVLVLNFLDNFFFWIPVGVRVGGERESKPRVPVHLGNWYLVQRLALPYYTCLCVLAHAAYLSRTECCCL